MAGRPQNREPRSYGRKRGRKLRPGRARLLEDALPTLAIAPPGPDEALDPRSLFDRAPGFDPAPDEVWLEIGFGAGEHLAWQAARHPDIGFIGCEIFDNGVAALLAAIEREGLTNVRILHGDAVALLDALPEASIGRAFVLHPDPWPKARHWKRRLIGEKGLKRLARVLVDDAELRIATDHPGYLVWILQHMLAAPEFAWTARRARDWTERPDDWPQTRYEKKALSEGRRATYLRLERRHR